MNPRDGTDPDQAPLSPMRATTEAGAPPPLSAAVTVALPHTTAAAEVARTFLASHAQALPSAVLADAQLLVSEIVSNAVLHGRPDISMTVRLTPPGIGIGIAVTDTGPELAQNPALPSPSATSGRGLFIVNVVAHAWGIKANGPPPGKSIWFELRGTRD